MIEKIVIIAKKESIPEIDVADRVMARLQSISPEPSLKPMGIVATFSAIAASIIMGLAIYSYKEQTNPWYSFFEPIEIAMPYDVSVLGNI